MNPGRLLSALRGPDARSLLRAVLVLFALSGIAGANAATAPLAAPLGVAYCLPDGGPTNGTPIHGHECDGFGCPAAPQAGQAPDATPEGALQGPPDRLDAPDGQRRAAVAIRGIGARGPPG